MKKEYLKRALTGILTGCLCLGLVAYIGYHLLGGSADEVTVLAASSVTVDEKNEYTGYIMRTEQVVLSQTDGGVSYRVSGGEKVASDTVVARVFDSAGSDEVRAQLVKLDNKLSVLARSTVDEGTRFTGTGIIDSQINETYYTIMSRLSDGDLDYVMRKKDELGVLLNRRKMLVKDVDSFDGAIAEVTEEQSSLIAGLGDAYTEIQVGQSGYFYTDIDGFEGIFDASKAAEMTAEDFEEMISSVPEESYSGYPIGKLVTDFKWYLALEIPQTEIIKYNTEYRYNIIFPYNSDKRISMRLDRMATSADGQRCVLVFSSSEMPKDFNYLRAQNVQIVSKSYSGYRVPASSVRVVDGVQGVYVLEGSVVRFKRIHPILESDGYIIVEKQDTTSDESVSYDLGYCDLIITEGKRLYDGKIIE